MVRFRYLAPLLVCYSLYARIESINAASTDEDNWEWKSDDVKPREVVQKNVEATLESHKSEDIQPRFISKMKKSICKGLGMGNKCHEIATVKDHIRIRRTAKIAKASPYVGDSGAKSSSRLLGSGFDGLFGSTVIPSVGVHLGSLPNGAGGHNLHDSSGGHKNPFQFDIGPVSVNPLAGLKFSLFNGRPIISPSLDFLLSSNKHKHHNVIPYAEQIPHYSYNSQLPITSPVLNQYTENLGIGTLPLGNPQHNIYSGYNQALNHAHQYLPYHPQQQNPPHHVYQSNHNYHHGQAPLHYSGFHPSPQIYPPVGYKRNHRHTTTTGHDNANKHDFPQASFSPSKKGSSSPTYHIASQSSPEIYNFKIQKPHAPIGYNRNSPIVKKDLFGKEKHVLKSEHKLSDFSNYGRVSTKDVSPFRSRDHIFASSNI